MAQKKTLFYGKNPGHKDLEEIHICPPNDLGEIEHPKTSNIKIQGYSKDDGILSDTIKCVISGGTTREKVFLNELVSKHTFKGLEIIFITSENKEGGLTPKQMMKKYESIYSNGTLNINGRSIVLEESDSIYMFTDVDHYYDELKEIKSQNNNSPIWIISNPDFEIWIYYCFNNNPNVDLKEILEIEPSKRSSKLKTINGTFNNNGGLDTRKAFENLEIGIQNSKANYFKDENEIPTLFSTEMHFFAEDVLITLGKEYFDWKNSKKEWHEEMKRKNKKKGKSKNK